MFTEEGHKKRKYFQHLAVCGCFWSFMPFPTAYARMIMAKSWIKRHPSYPSQLDEIFFEQQKIIFNGNKNSNFVKNAYGQPDRKTSIVLLTTSPMVEVYWTHKFIYFKG